MSAAGHGSRGLSTVAWLCLEKKVPLTSAAQESGNRNMCQDPQGPGTVLMLLPPSLPCAKPGFPAAAPCP